MCPVGYGMNQGQGQGPSDYSPHQSADKYEVILCKHLPSAGNDK